MSDELEDEWEWDEYEDDWDEDEDEWDYECTWGDDE